MSKIHITSYALISVALLAGGSLAQAQDAVAKSAPPTAAPADVDSVDGILKALYDTISGPQGKPRDWNRFRSLFAQDARLIPTIPPAENRPSRIQSLTVEQFIERVEPNTKTAGFYESEIARKVDTFGAVTHVFSTYESRRDPAAPPFVRGINSFQLFFDGKRFWVVTVYWDNERQGLAIPAAYLPQN